MTPAEIEALLFDAADALIAVARHECVEGENVDTTRPHPFRIDVRRSGEDYKIEIVSEGWLRRGVR